MQNGKCEKKGGEDMQGNESEKKAAKFPLVPLNAISLPLFGMKNSQEFNSFNFFSYNSQDTQQNAETNNRKLQCRYYLPTG